MPMARSGLLRRLLRRSGFDLKRYGPLMDPNLQRQGVLETTLSLVTAAIIVRMVLVVFIGDVTI